MISIGYQYIVTKTFAQESNENFEVEMAGSGNRSPLGSLTPSGTHPPRCVSCLHARSGNLIMLSFDVAFDLFRVDSSVPLHANSDKFPFLINWLFSLRVMQ